MRVTCCAPSWPSFMPEEQPPTPATTLEAPAPLLARSMPTKGRPKTKGPPLLDSALWSLDTPSALLSFLQQHALAPSELPMATLKLRPASAQLQNLSARPRQPQPPAADLWAAVPATARPTSAPHWTPRRPMDTPMDTSKTMRPQSAREHGESQASPRHEPSSPRPASPPVDFVSLRQQTRQTSARQRQLTSAPARASREAAWRSDSPSRRLPQPPV